MFSFNHVTISVDNLDKTLEFYKKFGFEEGELIEEFGYPNQRFVLHADKSVDNVIIGTKS